MQIFSRLDIYYFQLFKSTRDFIYNFNNLSHTYSSTPSFLFSCFYFPNSFLLGKLVRMSIALVFPVENAINFYRYFRIAIFIFINYNTIFIILLQNQLLTFTNIIFINIYTLFYAVLLILSFLYFYFFYYISYYTYIPLFVPIFLSLSFLLSFPFHNFFNIFPFILSNLLFHNFFPFLSIPTNCKFLVLLDICCNFPNYLANCSESNENISVFLDLVYSV